MKQTLSIILLLILSCCTGKNAQNQVEAKPLTKSTEKNVSKKDNIKGEKELNALSNSASTQAVDLGQESKIKIEFFSYKEIPEDIDGCGCGLFLSSQDQKAQKYIYIDSGDMVCMKINGKIELLDLKEFNEKTGIYIYAKESLSISKRITKRRPSKEEETTNVEAIITISKGTDKLGKKVVGYCGC